MDPTWEGLSPELLQMLAEYGVADERQAINLHNLKQAEQQAATEQPGVRAHGRMLLASSPLEHIGALLKSLQGQQQEGTIQQQMADLLRQKAATTSAYKQQEMDRRNRILQAAQQPTAPAPAGGLPWDFAGKLR